MSKKHLAFVLSVVAVAVLGLAAVVQADIIKLNYNFDNTTPTLNLGALADQDGWYYTNSNYLKFDVATGTGNWSGQGKFAEDTSTTAIEKRATGTLALQDNVNFDISCVVRAITTTQYKSYLQLGYNATPGSGALAATNITMGVTTRNSSYGLWWNFGLGTSATLLFDATMAIPAGWTSDQAVRVGFQFKSKGGNSWDVQRYYQVVGDASPTLVGTTATLDNFTPSNGSFGSYGTVLWNEMQMVSLTSGARIDDILITQVPEPSTMALLGCGLIGLLAYAWRKRK